MFAARKPRHATTGLLWLDFPGQRWQKRATGIPMFVRMYIVYRIACTHVPQHSHVTVVTTNEFFLVLTCVCAISIYVCIDSPVLHPRMSPLMHTLPSVVDGLKTPSTPVRAQHPRMSPLMLHPSSRCCLQTCCLQLPTRRARRLKHMILYKENKVLSVLSTGRRMCSTMLGRP